MANPLVNPGTFSGNDPRGSEYAANQVALEHQYETTLAGDQETLQNQRTNAAYQRSLIAKQEPTAFKANAQRANSEGLLESGVNASRRGNIQAGFLSQGTSINQRMTQAEARRTAADNIARENEQDGARKNIAAYNNDKLRWEEEHPVQAPVPAAAGPYPIPPAQQAAINNGVQPGPGGVVPYEGNGVRVGMPRRPESAAEKRYNRSRGR